MGISRRTRQNLHRSEALTKRILQRSPRRSSEHPEQRPKARLQALSRRQRCFVVRFRRSRALARVHMRSAPAASASRARSTRPFSAPRSGAPLPIACRTRDSLPLSPGEVRVSSYRPASEDRRSLRWVSIDSNHPRLRVSSRRVARVGPPPGGRPAFRVPPSQCSPWRVFGTRPPSQTTRDLTNKPPPSPSIRHVHRHHRQQREQRRNHRRAQDPDRRHQVRSLPSHPQNIPPTGRPVPRDRLFQTIDPFLLTTNRA